MRRFFRIFKAILVACGTALFALFLLMLYRSPVFQEGESYTFYFQKNSSALFFKAPAAQKLFLTGTAGESTEYEGNCLCALMEKYRATLLFTEEAAGVLNYYCYSPMLGDCVQLFGERVNLHIAVSEWRTAVGTPLLFGGY